MLNDGTGFKKVYLATGFTDLRRGIDGLARVIRFQFQLDPYDKNTLFLFCGKRTDRIKELIWEGDGFHPFIRIELLFEIISWKAQKLRLSKKSSRIMISY